MLKPEKSAENALKYVLEGIQGENILIICDNEKEDVGEAFAEGAISLGLWTRLLTLQTTKKVRKEVPQHLLEVLAQKKPSIYINLMRETREETPFRIEIIKIQTREKKSRLGHCPGVTLDMLEEGALALTKGEHEKIQGFACSLIQKLHGATLIEVTNPSGTDLSLNVEGREFISDTKFNWNLMKWLNLPTGEVYAAPVEYSLEGKLVCDMAVGGIGKVHKPLEIIAHKGRVKTVHSKERNILEKVQKTLKTDDWAGMLGEFAFGINPKARFVNQFLEAEKIQGTIHIAFGQNTDMPSGKNASKNHMDLLISEPTVKISKAKKEQITILEGGNFIL